MPVISVGAVGDGEGVGGESAERLRVVSEELKNSGNLKTTPDQNKKTNQSVDDVIKALSGDPLLDPTKVTKDHLEARFLDPKAVDQILQLKAIFDQVAAGKPVNVDQLTRQLDAVVADLERDSSIRKSAREIHKIQGDLQHKEADIALLNGMLDGLPTDGSPLDPTKVDELQSQIEDLMAKLAGNPDLRPEDVNLDTLKEMGLGVKVTDQLLMLKTLHDDLASGDALDLENLKEGLAAVLKDLEKDVEVEKEEAGKFEEASTKLKAVEALQAFEKGLPADGNTTIDQNVELANLVQDIAKDLAKDPSLDLSSVTRDDLRTLGLAPSTIDEIMALQDLFNDASSGVSLPVNDLISKIDDLKDQLTADANDDIRDAEVLKTDDPIEHGLHGVDKLNKLRETLPASGPLDDDQKYAVKVTVEEVVKELAGDPLFDPKSATEDALKAA